MNGKTPVSALQELMAAKRLPLPTYIEENYGDKFKCTVHAGGVTAVGIASTKKAAKHQSAENALIQMGVLKKPQPQIIYINKTVTQPPMKNYVGDLNEFSSKHGIKYPDYTVLNSGFLGNDFLIQCSFQRFQTVGKSTNKKDAKQDAARQMLLVIGKESQDFEILHSKTVANPENLGRVIALYETLSLNAQPKQSVADKSIVSPVPEITIDEKDNVDVLKAKLQELGIEYTISDFQTDPEIVVSLVIQGTNFTFLESGKTREEAIKKILQKVLLVKKSGCSFNADLISF